jgi:hypothetical protein
LQHIYQHTDPTLLCMQLLQQLFDITLIPNGLEFHLPCFLTTLMHTFLDFCMYFSSHLDKTKQLVNVVSKVFTRSSFSRKTSVSLSSSNCICDNEAAVSLSCAHRVETVTGARFHALRISHNVCAAPTQLPVIRSCHAVSEFRCPSCVLHLESGQVCIYHARCDGKGIHA